MYVTMDYMDWSSSFPLSVWQYSISLQQIATLFVITKQFECSPTQICHSTRIDFRSVCQEYPHISTHINGLKLNRSPPVTHIIYASASLVSNIGSDNGFSPFWHQAIIWTNAALLSWNTLQRNFHQNRKYFINKNAFKNIVCEMAAILSRGRWIRSNKICGQFSCNESKFMHVHSI